MQISCFLILPKPVSAKPLVAAQIRSKIRSHKHFIESFLAEKLKTDL